MKMAALFLLFALSASAADKVAPTLEKASSDEIRKALTAIESGESDDLSMIRRGLISDQTYDRARCAQSFIKHGSIDDVPFLIDALSDESMHVGANYPLAGMATTRYWANVALIVICKTSYDYQWDSPLKDRKYSISLWKQHWDRIKPKEKD